MVWDALWSTPQYAYVSGKAIDEAVSRVSRHCGQIRDLPRQGNRTVHDKRRGVAAEGCRGGIQISVDLSQAFDHVRRPMLEAALRFAGAEEPLIQALLHLHEQSVYHV